MRYPGPDDITDSGTGILYLVPTTSGHGKRLVRKPRAPLTSPPLDDDFDAFTLEATTMRGGFGGFGGAETDVGGTGTRSNGHHRPLSWAAPPTSIGSPLDDDFDAITYTTPSQRRNGPGGEMGSVYEEEYTEGDVELGQGEGEGDGDGEDKGSSVGFGLAGRREGLNLKGGGTRRISPSSSNRDHHRYHHPNHRGDSGGHTMRNNNSNGYETWWKNDYDYSPRPRTNGGSRHRGPGHSQGHSQGHEHGHGHGHGEGRRLDPDRMITEEDHLYNLDDHVGGSGSGRRMDHLVRTPSQGGSYYHQGRKASKSKSKSKTSGSRHGSGVQVVRSESGRRIPATTTTTTNTHNTNANANSNAIALTHSHSYSHSHSHSRQHPHNYEVVNSRILEDGPERTVTISTWRERVANEVHANGTGAGGRARSEVEMSVYYLSAEDYPMELSGVLEVEDRRDRRDIVFETADDERRGFDVNGKWVGNGRGKGPKGKGKGKGKEREGYEDMWDTHENRLNGSGSLRRTPAANRAYTPWPSGTTLADITEEKSDSFKSKRSRTYRRHDYTPSPPTMIPSNDKPLPRAPTPTPLGGTSTNGDHPWLPPNDDSPFPRTSTPVRGTGTSGDRSKSQSPPWLKGSNTTHSHKLSPPFFHQQQQKRGGGNGSGQDSGSTTLSSNIHPGITPALETILTSCDPPLLHLAPVLVSMGIRTEDHLRAIGKLSSGTRDREIREEALKRGVTIMEWAILLDRLQAR